MYLIILLCLISGKSRSTERRLRRLLLRKTGILRTDCWIGHQHTSLISWSLKGTKWNTIVFSGVHRVLYVALTFFCLFNRYPTFVDALRDLDDCLTLVHLFAALPAVDGERVEVKRIHSCRRFVLFDIAKIFSATCYFRVCLVIKGYVVVFMFLYVYYLLWIFVLHQLKVA